MSNYTDNMSIRAPRQTTHTDWLQSPTIAVLVLYKHVVVLGPGGVVADHVLVLVQHRMGVHLIHGCTSEINSKYQEYMLQKWLHCNISFLI